MILLLLAILPAILLTFRSGFEQRLLAAESAQAEALRLARLAATYHIASIEGARQLLIALSQIPELQQGNPEACSFYLRRLASQFENYTSLNVLLPDGTLYCTSLINPLVQNYSDDPFFQVALQRQEFIVGNYMVGINSGIPIIPFYYPMFNEYDELIGLVAASLNLKWFSVITSDIDLPDNSALLMVDSQGTILARHPNPELWVGQFLPESPNIQAIIIQRGEGFTEVPGIDGVERLYAFTPLDHGWSEPAYISIGIPTRIAYAVANRELFQNLSILSIAAVLAIGIYWVISNRYFVLPVTTLIRTIQRVEMGQLNARTDFKEDYGEISLLGNSFNQMADSLEQREQQVLEAEAKYRTLVEQIPAVIYTVSLDKEFKTFYVSPQVEDILGYLSEEWLANPDIWSEGIHPYDRESVLSNMQQAVIKHEPFRSEYRFKARNGVMLWIRDEALPVYDIYGKPAFLQGIMLDITERRQAEFALQDYTVQLERSNRELQDFAYIASHDLQEPLRKIQAFGERLETKFADVLQEEGQGYLERMRSSAARMQTLINDLLSYSRVTTKAQPFISVDLEKIAQEVLMDLAERIHENNGRIEIEELPQIEADPLQMRQLFQNLIGNGLKFHRPNIPPRICISGSTIYKGNEKYAEITVEDNGIGFDEKYLNRIFQPFQRLHGRGQYEGSGIGLAICRKIVERHDGTISARSSPNEGSTFVIHLPAKHNTRGAEYEN
jgi:PAS domain S-box-containing protein